MSIIRAGFVAFPISPRNSPTAVAHLINKVGVSHALIGHEPAMRDLVQESLKILNTHYPTARQPGISLIPLFEELFLSPNEITIQSEDIPYEHPGFHSVVMILHSSGSTAYPKPIEWTFHRFSQLALIPWFGERDLTDQVFSLHTMPMYHGMGVLQLCWTVRLS